MGDGTKRDREEGPMDPQIALHAEGRADGGVVAGVQQTWGTSSFSTDGSLNDVLSMLSGDDDASTSISGTSASTREQPDGSGDSQQVLSSLQWSLGLSISKSGTIVSAAGRPPTVPPPTGGNPESTGSSESSHESSSSEEPLVIIPTVPVPESALSYLTHSLGGPVRKYCVWRPLERCCINRVTHDWFHRRIRLRVWLGTACGQTISGGYLLQYFYSLVGTDIWTKFGYFGFIVWTVVGTLLVEGSMHAALAVVDGHVDAATPAGWAASPASLNGESLLAGSPQSPRSSHFQIMTMLLKSEVTEATAVSINRAIKLARLQSYGYMFVIVFCYGSMLMGVSTEGVGSSQEVDWYNVMHQFLAVAGMCLCPCTAMVVSGWLLFISLPCMAVADHVRISTQQVSLLGRTRSRGGQSEDQRRLPWNAMMTAVEEAHIETVKLAAVLSPVLAVMSTLLGLVSFFFLASALIPRIECSSPAPLSSEDCIANTEGSPGKIVLDYLVPYVFFCFSVGTAVFLVWQMFGPADVSLACDELVDAIRSLKVLTDEQNKAVLLDPESLIRAEGIARFAEELNRGQGLGFVFRKQKLTPPLVSGVLAKSVVWIVLAFPTLITLSMLMVCPDWVPIGHNDTDDNSTCLDLPDVSDPAVWTVFFIPMLLLAAWGLFRWTRHPDAPDLPLGDVQRSRV
jgi:hypothetical protein